MKRLIFLYLFLVMIFAAQTAHAQSVPNNVDPQTAQAISAAIQRGDTEGAKKVYEDYRNSKNIDGLQSGIRTRPTTTDEGPSFFEKTLSRGLKQFGYDLFKATASSFHAAATLPVGPDYIIGPGDHFTMTLWGTTEGIYALQVTKEGNITLPKVGVVPVAGLRFGELEGTLRRHLSKYYSNFNLSVAMGGLKTITVYVVGEVSTPGSYSLSSLTTVYGALFSAGGPTKKGTLRKIQVLRSGKVIKTLDLYDFLLKGDRSQDMKLQNDDTVFVSLIGPVAGVSGAVYRPAIYELKGRESINDVLQSAGGIMPNSLANRLQLTRYSDNQRKVIKDIRMAAPQSDAAGGELKETVMNMDVIHILPIYDKVWETVSLLGDVRHPGDFQWRQDLKLKEIIQNGQLLPTADFSKGEIVRLSDDYRDRTIIAFKLDALMKGDESQNILLRPKDQVRVFTLYRKAEKVSVTGEVMSADIETEQTMNDGAETGQAARDGAEARQTARDGAEARQAARDGAEARQTARDGAETGQAARDGAEARQTARDDAEARQMARDGKARAGEYEIYKGERLSDLLRRVGGFTKEAYPYGTVFKRRGVKNAQAQNLQIFITRMQSQMLQSSAEGAAKAGSAEEAAAAKGEAQLNQSLLENLKAMQMQFEGRISINITENIDSWAGSKDDLMLQDGDSIVIPKRPQEVIVMGEVRNPGAEVFQPQLRVKDYISQNGGLTTYAADEQIFVLQANGFAVSSDTPSVGNVEKMTLQAGDTIIVPQKVDRYVGWRWTRDILDVLFKLAVTAATLKVIL